MEIARMGKEIWPAKKKALCITQDVVQKKEIAHNIGGTMFSKLTWQ
jgi:hypothetical protein